jgi:hypothetical protein
LVDSNRNSHNNGNGNGNSNSSRAAHDLQLCAVDSK